MTKAKLIEKLNKMFPKLNAVDGALFDDNSSNGIWFRGTEETFIDSQYLINDSYEVHPKFEALLHEAGWFGEPYDKGTLLAFED